MKYHCDILPVIADIQWKHDNEHLQPTLQQRVLQLFYLQDIISHWSTKWQPIYGTGFVFASMREYNTIHQTDPEAWELYCGFTKQRASHTAIEIFY